MNKVRLLFLLLVIVLGGGFNVFAQSKDEKAILSQLEKLKQAMLNDDKSTLENITSSLLSYGHSSGLIEDQRAFIDAILDNTANFTSIEISDVSVTVAGNVAYVRHKLYGNTLNKGHEPGKVQLGVFLVWQKNNQGNWLLLGRQAFKI